MAVPPPLQLLRPPMMPPLTTAAATLQAAAGAIGVTASVQRPGAGRTAGPARAASCRRTAPPGRRSTSLADRRNAGAARQRLHGTRPWPLDLAATAPQAPLPRRMVPEGRWVRSRRRSPAARRGARMQPRGHEAHPARRAAQVPIPIPVGARRHGVPGPIYRGQIHREQFQREQLRQVPPEPPRHGPRPCSPQGMRRRMPQATQWTVCRSTLQAMCPPVRQEAGRGTHQPGRASVPTAARARGTIRATRCPRATALPRQRGPVSRRRSHFPRRSPEPNSPSSALGNSTPPRHDRPKKTVSSAARRHRAAVSRVTPNATASACPGDLRSPQRVRQPGVRAQWVRAHLPRPEPGLALAPSCAQES